jgi:hypothetical protein
VIRNEEDAANACAAFGFHPGVLPGDTHHSDEKLTDEDRAMGDAIAWFLGTTWIDCNVMAPVEEWSRIARALRMHGLKITDRK